jgi:hypothetical protein
MTDIHIRAERLNHPQAATLLDQLDAYLASLYAPEHNHILDVQALLATQAATVWLYERCGYAQSGPFGAYPDNGRSVFCRKALA